jgi:cytochrome c2
VALVLSVAATSWFSLRAAAAPLPTGALQAAPAAQAPAGGRGGNAPGPAPLPPEPRSNVGPADRPKVDPVAAARGAHVWGVECITCHGAKARGTDNGPNLLRSSLVLHDRAGNLLGPFLKKGHPTQGGMPSADFTAEQVTDLMHFLRQRINDTLRGSTEFTEKDILVGDAQAGAAYFNGAGQCTTCHSVTGDLAHIGSRFGTPVDLQQRMLFPTPPQLSAGATTPNRTAITVTLSSPGGPTISGVLLQMDDFYVTYRDAANAEHIVKRTPGMKVQLTDPLQTHHELLDRITDTNIHDLVAYLETQK